MNKKNLKLIMELIFIFILPLVFICFTSEIQIEREFTYDNEGNYETSQDTKSLSFDNSIIKYTKTESIQSLNLVTFPNSNTELTGDFYIKISDIEDGYYTLYYNDLGKNIIQIQFRETQVRYYDEETPDENNYNILDTVTINGDNYYKFNWLNTQFNYYDYGEILINNGYYQYTNQTTTKNTIWGNIKQLLIDNLDLNDNVLLDIVLCYMILWLIHWIIWHLFYGILELLWHVIPSPIERRL